MRKFVLLTGLLTAGVVLAACSSSSSSSSGGTSGTETIIGVVTGASAANQLNSSNNNAPLTLHSLTFSGPVSVVTGPVSLGSGQQATFSTPSGDLAVNHTEPNSEEQPEPAITGKSGNLCYFKGSLGNGTYTVDGSKSTGKFAGATGHGTFNLTVAGAAQLQSGTTCNINNLGNVVAKGAALTFKASGPLTLKS